MKKVIIMLLSSLALVACSVSADAPELIPPAPVASARVPTYEVAFDNISNTFAHTYKQDLSEDELRIEYKIFSPVDMDVKLDLTTSSVLGCSASLVEHKIYWIEDNLFPTYSRSVIENDWFKVFAGIKGTLVHKYRFLSGCKSIEVYTNLKK